MDKNNLPLVEAWKDFKKVFIDYGFEQDRDSGELFIATKKLRTISVVSGMLSIMVKPAQFEEAFVEDKSKIKIECVTFHRYRQDGVSQRLSYDALIPRNVTVRALRDMVNHAQGLYTNLHTFALTTHKLEFK